MTIPVVIGFVRSLGISTNYKGGDMNDTVDGTDLVLCALIVCCTFGGLNWAWLWLVVIIELSRANRRINENL